jgi:hypothetical protein
MYHAEDAQKLGDHGTVISEFARKQLADSISITTPPTRKRQKKADSRVAELERKIDALTATLHAQKSGGTDIKHHGGIPQHEGNTAAMAMPEGSFRMGSISHEWSSPAQGPYTNIPPGYGPAQTIQRGPEAKRRKVNNGQSHAVGDSSAL